MKDYGTYLEQAVDEVTNAIDCLPLNHPDRPRLDKIHDELDQILKENEAIERRAAEEGRA